jgi:hypothetical protein
MLYHLIEFIRTLAACAAGTAFGLWAFPRKSLEEDRKAMLTVIMNEAVINERKIARIERHLKLEPLFENRFDHIDGPR